MQSHSRVRGRKSERKEGFRVTLAVSAHGKTSGSGDEEPKLCLNLLVLK